MDGWEGGRLGAKSLRHPLQCPRNASALGLLSEPGRRARACELPSSTPRDFTVPLMLTQLGWTNCAGPTPGSHPDFQFSIGFLPFKLAKNEHSCSSKNNICNI